MAPHPKATDLPALLAKLCDAGVEFIIVGGAACVIQGAPITTNDLDIVHRRTPENVERLLVPARIHLGVTMFSLGRRDAAMAEWHEVLRIDPSNKRAQLYIRMCNDENGPQPGSALPR